MPSKPITSSNAEFSRRLNEVCLRGLENMPGMPTFLRQASALKARRDQKGFVESRSQSFVGKLPHVRAGFVARGRSRRSSSSKTS